MAVESAGVKAHPDYSMLVDPDVLHRARKGNRNAVIEVLAAQYPATYRIALGLSGREDVGDGIVRYVMKQSFRVVPAWNDEESPQRWFRHHTLLTVRRAARWKPEPVSDTLVTHSSDESDAAYIAFIRALRELPQQQTEAFILAHGEKLDMRNLAVAMDCSTTAAANHLREAEERLTQLSGAQFDSLVVRMQQAFERLTPSKDLILSRIQSSARRHFWPRLIRRAAKLSVVLAILTAVGWLVWKYHPQIVDFVSLFLGRLRIA